MVLFFGVFFLFCWGGGGGGRAVRISIHKKNAVSRQISLNI